MFAVTSARKLAGRRLSAFHEEVINGLKASQKYLQSKYFYDETGDKLFQQIMASPEYYLTRCEMEIMQHQSPAIADCFEGQPFDLVELGPGDATKSWHLLRELMKRKAPFTYYPIDISSQVIEWLDKKLPAGLPGIQVQGLNGEYMDKMEYVEQISQRRKIVLFMGANIGNMTMQQAMIFCRQLHDRMRPGDLLLIGFDLKKDPATILAAYNDKQGVTRAFNLNLLKRINNELDANFDVDQFTHYPVYDPGTGSCKSYLISKIAQDVHIGEDTVIHFKANESIYMEISQKYSLEDTYYLARQSGFKPVHEFFDAKNMFADILWERMD